MPSLLVEKLVGPYSLCVNEARTGLLLARVVLRDYALVSEHAQPPWYSSGISNPQNMQIPNCPLL